MSGVALGFGAVFAVMLIALVFSPGSPPPGYGYDRPWWKVLLGRW